MFQLQQFQTGKLKNISKNKLKKKINIDTSFDFELSKDV